MKSTQYVVIGTDPDGDGITYPVDTEEQIQIAARALREAGLESAVVIATPHTLDWIAEHGDPDAVETSSRVFAAKEPPAVNVTIENDPLTLGPDATAADLERFRVALERHLGERFMRDVTVRIASVSGYGAVADDPEIDEHLKYLERTDGWLALLDEDHAPEEREP